MRLDPHSSENSLLVTLACPCCHGDMEIELRCEPGQEGCHLPLGARRCLNCGKELLLYVSRKDHQYVEVRLVDPSREWTFEEIMDREG
jgi:hypothetical protein